MGPVSLEAEFRIGKGQVPGQSCGRREAHRAVSSRGAGIAPLTFRVHLPLQPASAGVSPGKAQAHTGVHTHAWAS